MVKYLINPAQIITVDSSGENCKRGNSLKEIKPVYNHSIVIENDLIKDLIPNSSLPNTSSKNVIDLKDKIILPGLIECHTHTAFAGSRANEFKDKLSGVSYEEIAKAGGGINATVQAVRAASFNELVKLIQPRIEYFISQGITTLEIKSGYGLDFDNEIKLLKVINYLNEFYPIDIIPTFLGAHTFPNELKDNHQKYISDICENMLPHIAKNKLAKFCDGFCEATAFSAEEIDKIFSSAKKLGLQLRLHTDQFNNIGGIDTAIRLNASSVDHLEVINDSDLLKLKASNVSAVLLPGVSFFLDYQYAPARKLIDNNIVVALSTDYNPGSSNISNLSFIMSLAALKMWMLIEESISAVTINAAKVLQMEKTIGSIEINKKADFSIFNTIDYSDIVYNVAKNLNVMTIKNGKIIYNNGEFLK